MTKNMAFNTGLQGAALTEMSDMVGQLSTKTPASLAQIGAAATQVGRNLHLTGDDLATVTRQVVEFDEKTGQALNVRQLGQVARAFNLDGKGVSALLDELYTAYTKTGIGVDQMTATLIKAGPLLRQYGLDAGQSADFLEQFDEAGVDINKLIPSLGHAFKDSAKAGESFQQFIRDNVKQIAALHKAGDDVAAANLANKIFGSSFRGGGITWLDMIKSGKLDLENLGQGGGPPQSILKNAEAAQTISEKFQIMRNNIDEALRPAAMPLFDQLGHGVESLTKWVQGHEPADHRVLHQRHGRRCCVVGEGAADPGLGLAARHVGTMANDRPRLWRTSALDRTRQHGQGPR